MAQLAPSHHPASSPEPAPGAADPAHQARGRHATPSGQGYGFVVAWTILGTLLPGVGLIAAGRKVLGWFLVGLCAALGIGAAAFFLTADSPLDAVVRLAGIAVDPTTLLYVIGAIIAAGLLWILVVVLTHRALRRETSLVGGQRVMASGLVVALAALIAVPTAYASDLALVQRDLITSVFGDEPTTDAIPGERPQAGKADPWANLPRVNVLLIGSDAGDDREGTRTDSLILVSIDTKTGNAVMFSLPRNLERAPFPIGTDGARAWPDGFSCAEHACLINAVYNWAETNQDGYYAGVPHPGIAATRDVVEGTLGLRVDQYALVDLHGFQRVVDAMGGITIDVLETVPIGGGHTLSGRPIAIKGYITAGKDQHLDGYHALWYARSRATSDDYARMARQRCVIGAIIKKADPLTLVKAYPKLAAAAKEDIGTDVPQADLSAWVELALKIKGGSVRSLPFDDKVVADRANPDFEKIRALVQQSLVEPSSTPSSTPTPTTPATQPPGGATTPAADPSATATYDPNQAQDLTSVC